MNSGLEFLGEAVIQNNLLLLQGLGIYALTRYTDSLSTAFRAGLAMVSAMISASVVLWAVESLVPGLFGLETPVILLAALVSGLFWQRTLGGEKWVPGFNGALVSGLVNSSLVGMLLIVANSEATGVQIVSSGISYSLGFWLALVVMAGIRERLDLAPVPKPLRGVPILLVAAGLLGVALMGFRF